MELIHLIAAESSLREIQAKLGLKLVRAFPILAHSIRDPGRSVPPSMDQLLRPYLLATEESEREEHLEQLLLFYAAPEIRFTLRQKLGFHVNEQGLNPNNRDAEDLYQEIIAKTVQLLRDIHTSSRPEIENFKNYICRTATNACISFIRAKSPARWRLKNNLRDILSRQPEFALWTQGNETLGGFASWTAMNALRVWPSDATTLEEEVARFRGARFRNGNLNQVPLKKVVGEVLNWVTHPLSLDTLLGFMAILLDIKDEPVESLDDKSRAWLEARVGASTVSASWRLDEEDLLRQLWRNVRTLPAYQRDAYCFRFETTSGQDLFSLLL